MTRLVHLTDLHFGAERPDLVAPLTQALRDCDPDFIAVSGDLSHRARLGQLRAGLQFLKGLNRPCLLIPGNHDIPLWNFPLRFAAPLWPWRRVVPQDIGHFAQAGRIRLFGVNTADPWAWRTGILRDCEVARVEAALRAGRGDLTLNLLVCHHPIEEPPGFQRGETKGAAEGIARLTRAGLHGVLSGHLHHWQIGLGITPEQPRALLQIQTGTALCGRAGERDHGFTVIEAAPMGLRITPWIIDEERGVFRAAQTQLFERGAGLWHRMAEPS